MASADTKDILTYAEEHPQDELQNNTRLRKNKWWQFSGKDRSFVPTKGKGSNSSITSSQDDVYSLNEGTVYSDARAAEIYKPIEKYEGRHRFDIRATWSDEEEKKLVRRVRRVTPSYRYVDQSFTARLEGCLVGMCHVLCPTA